jgi:cysteine desulfurase/selenocysteine lyase
VNAERRAFMRACAGVAAGLSPLASAANLPGRAAADAVEQSLAPPSAGANAWRTHFPAFRAADAGTIYLDSAATTHRAQAAIDAIVRYYEEDNANPARVHARARRAAECLAAARQTIAAFLNAADPLEVIFTRGTTEAINLAAATWGAANLEAGDRIILTISEHNSNLLPWTTAARRAGAEVRVVDVDDEGRLRLDDLRRHLSPRTRLVAFSHVSNVLGIVNPVKEIASVARAAGARVFVDGAQGAPHVPIDVRDLQCDFYAFSGHKMAGPMGSGVLWASRALLDAMPPYHVGSNMAHEVDFERAVFEHGALKFQAGTPDVAQPVGLAAAANLLMSSRAAVASHDEMLVRRGLRRLRAIPGLTLIGSGEPPHRVPVFTFNVHGWKAVDLAAALDARGIAVRAGDMAALPLLKRFGVTEAVRASAYAYNSLDEIDRLAEALDDLAAGSRR